LSYVFVGQDLNRWEMIYEHPDCVEAPRPFYCWIYRELQRMKTSNPVTLINCMVDRLMLAQEMQIQGGKA
jgi:hypothetical protein